MVVSEFFFIFAAELNNKKVKSMKKLFMVFVCLMTMVLSANAQVNGVVDGLNLVKTDYKSTIPFECAILGFDGDKFSRVRGAITIDYSYYEDLGNSISFTVKVDGKTAFNYFKDVSFLIGKDVDTGKKVYVVKDNFEDTLLILKPIGEKMANAFSFDTNSYIFAIYNEVILE